MQGFMWCDDAELLAASSCWMSRCITMAVIGCIDSREAHPPCWCAAAATPARSAAAALCSVSVLHDCMTVWLHDCCREIWRMLLATNHCTHCGGYAVVVAHTGDSSQNLCGDHSPLTLARGAQTNGGHHFSCYVKNYFFVINVVDIEWSFFSFFSVQLFPENRQWWLRLRTADWHRYRTRIMHSQY